MADSGRQIIEEITSSSGNTFTTRNRVISHTYFKGLMAQVNKEMQSHFGDDVPNYLISTKELLPLIITSTGGLMRNMMKLRGHTNILYLHNHAEAAIDTDIRTWPTSPAPLNHLRVLGPVVSKMMGYDDINFYPAYSGTDTNFTKKVFEANGLTCVETAGQYELGDNVVLSGVPDGVKFDAVYMYGVERGEDRQYTIEEIREDFSAYTTDNCYFYDYYETTEARNALELRLSDCEDNGRWSSTPKDNDTIFNFSYHALNNNADSLEAGLDPIAPNLRQTQYGTNVLSMVESGNKFMNRIFKVF
jgi:hypothetical protein